MNKTRESGQTEKSLDVIVDEYFLIELALLQLAEPVINPLEVADDEKLSNLAQKIINKTYSIIHTTLLCPKLYNKFRMINKLMPILSILPSKYFYLFN